MLKPDSNKARSLLNNEIDPGQSRQESKRLGKIAAENSFESIAREWHAKFSIKWTPKHAARTLCQFEKEIFPWLGKRAITQITAPELLAALRRTESRGAIETAHRAHQTCSQVFRYAIATGRAERDPSANSMNLATFNKASTSVRIKLGIVIKIMENPI